MSDSNEKVLTKKINAVQLIFGNANKKPNQTNNQYIYPLLENSSTVKVACSVPIWKKKHFVKIVTSLVTVLFKMALYLCVYFVFIKKA